MFLADPDRTPYDVTFRLHDIPVRVSPWFWLISAMFSWDLIRYGMEYVLLSIFCVFVSILLHELGHVLMGRYFGTRGHIVLHGFGGLAIGSSDLSSRWQRMAVSFAGPLAQLLLYAVLRLAARLVLMENLGHRLLLVALAQLLAINLYWPLLNLLPIWPLDGGQISRELLTGYRRRQGLRWSLYLSIATAGLFVVNALMVQATDFPLIPFLPVGGPWMVILFGMLAWYSYQMLQALGPPRSPWDQPRSREPWEGDADSWKR